MPTTPFTPIFNYPNNKLYQYEVYPVRLNCNFVVDSTNGNGFGIRSLKGAGIASIFMHTSASPGTTEHGVLNPNPASGIIMLTMQNQFNRVLASSYSIISPLSGSSLTAVTAHTAYVIVSLGTATQAQWVAVGFPSNMVPAVGAAFVATATGTIGGSAAVQVPSHSGIMSLEGVGDPNVTLQSSNMYAQGGGQLVIQCLNASSALTAPADNSVISLELLLSNSSVSVSGQ